MNRIASLLASLSLVAVAFLLPTEQLLAQNAEPGRVALIIGNSDYDPDGLWPSLDDVPDNDSKLLAATLRQAGFEVTVAENLNKTALLNRLIEFKAQIPKGGTALFYFGGHGVEYLKTNYLMAVNSRFHDKDLLGEEAIEADTVVKMITGAQPKVAMVFLDCCREAPPSSWVVGDYQTKGFGTRGLIEMETPPDLVVGFSASAGSLANARVKLESNTGPYAEALCRHILSGEELTTVMRNAARDVYQASVAAKQKFPDEPGLVVQRPARYGEVLHDFYFVPKGAPVNVAAVTVTPKPKPAMRKTNPPSVPVPPAPVGAPGSMEGARAGEVRVLGGIEFVWCPQGEFQMGSPASEEDRGDDEKQHRVELTRGFWLAKTECTQGQYEAIMGENPSEFTGSD
ncbi:MAG: hypothetical protein ACI8UO_005062, partial [Verrucomicrobiales bacterium]